MSKVCPIQARRVSMAKESNEALGYHLELYFNDGYYICESWFAGRHTQRHYVTLRLAWEDYLERKNVMEKLINQEL